MAGGGGFSTSVHSTDLENLVRALRAEADGGKQFRKELARNMREALKPAAAEAKNAIGALPSSGRNAGPGLRQQIAKKIRPEVRLTGRSTGARVKARKLPAGIRNFANAPRRTQQATWRTQTFGNGEWREQQGKLDWFDNSMNDKAAEYKEAVVDAMTDMARRIVNRI